MTPLQTPLADLAARIPYQLSTIGSPMHEDPGLILLFAQLRSWSLQTLKGAIAVPGRTEFNVSLLPQRFVEATINPLRTAVRPPRLSSPLSDGWVATTTCVAFTSDPSLRRMPRPRPQARSLLGVLPPSADRTTPALARTQPIPTPPFPPPALDPPRHRDPFEPWESSAISGADGWRRVPRGAQRGEEGGKGASRVRHELVRILRALAWTCTVAPLCTSHCYNELGNAVTRIHDHCAASPAPASCASCRSDPLPLPRPSCPPSFSASWAPSFHPPSRSLADEGTCERD